MRKFIVFAAACLVACSFLLTVQPASAALESPVYNDYSGAWELAGGNTNAFVLNYTSDANFGIYDINDDTNRFDLIFGNGNIAWFNIKDGIVSLNGQEINDLVFNGSQFGIFKGDWDVTKNLVYDIRGDTNNWNIAFGELDPELQIMNANPVPIPTAMLLLGSGLVGLAGFRRKTKN